MKILEGNWTSDLLSFMRYEGGNMMITKFKKKNPADATSYVQKMEGRYLVSGNQESSEIAIFDENGCLSIYSFEPDEYISNKELVRVKAGKMYQKKYLEWKKNNQNTNSDFYKFASEMLGKKGSAL